jgi:quercetin dioxygenase-like cupin family protein
MMRALGGAVVILGMAMLAFIAIDATRTPVSGQISHPSEMDAANSLQRLIFWSAFFGVVAAALLIHGVGGMLMARRDRSSAVPSLPQNGDTAAMIEAEVNEGGPPSPVPCDTPFERTAYQEKHTFMSEKHPVTETCPSPDRILHLPIGKAVGAAQSATLMKSAGLELIRLVIPAGKEIPPHRVPGEITVQCLEGHVAFEHDGHSIDLHAGDLLHLCPQESHALKGIVDSSVLVTRLRPHADDLPEKFPPN